MNYPITLMTVNHKFVELCSRNSTARNIGVEHGENEPPTGYLKSFNAPESLVLMVAQGVAQRCEAQHVDLALSFRRLRRRNGSRHLHTIGIDT